MTDEEIREALRLDFEQTADWRRSKAAEYPEAAAFPGGATSNASRRESRPDAIARARLGTDDREDRQDRWKPSIQLDKEPAIVVREPDSALYLTPQNDQLMSECRILCFKLALRLE